MDSNRGSFVYYVLVMATNTSNYCSRIWFIKQDATENDIESWGEEQFCNFLVLNPQKY